MDGARFGHASRCAAGAKGAFEIVFVRAKENAPDLEFHEWFRWRPTATKVSYDLWADEWVDQYWIGAVAPCPCRA